MSGHAAIDKPPTSRSQLGEQCAAMGKHHHDMRQQDLVIAAVLRRIPQLRTLVGRPIAYRISRQFAHAAALNTELQKAYRRAWDLYEQGRAKHQAGQSGWSDK
jgi:hypothetical protein